ncbi:PilZ domain-containing protein [Dyella sp.]|jgi:hypothetical protein|uniref:PilZ domain-containing protein n=1 Tax=Dyella sp. TaxID=1869338 RepID=UPI002D7A0A8B|nr:PilZ domain-containing protein [Dyella sp.]HET6431187.1 PilZ domain-containing protein [Dyella sp.]
MNSQSASNEQRRALRKRVNFTAAVTDMISGQPMGFLGNLSAGGMLLICARAPRPDAIYQVQLPLHGLEAQPQTIEVGVQAQWYDPGSAPGQIWAGFRIIAVSPKDSAVIDRWIAMAP